MNFDSSLFNSMILQQFNILVFILIQQDRLLQQLAQNDDFSSSSTWRFQVNSIVLFYSIYIQLRFIYFTSIAGARTLCESFSRFIHIIFVRLQRFGLNYSALLTIFQNKALALFTSRVFFTLISIQLIILLRQEDERNRVRTAR